jgi:O-antigen/teichoic acid export membrane protein
MGIIIKQTFRSSLWAYLGIALGFFTSIFVMTKVLTTEQVGFFRIMGITYLGLLMSLSNLGVNAAGVRMFPYFRDNRSTHHGYLGLACLVSLVGFVLCMIVFFAFRPLWVREQNTPNPLLDQYLWTMIPLTFSMLFFNIFDNYAKNLFDSVSGTFLREFAQRFFLLLVYVGYGLGFYSFEILVWLWLVAMGLPMVLMFMKIWKDGTVNLKIDWHFLTPQLRRQFADIAGFSILSGLTTTITLQIDSYLVKDMISVADAGIYGTLLMFGTVIAMPAQNMNRIAGSIIAEAWKRNDMDNIQTVYNKSCLTQLIIGMLIFLGIVCNIHNVFAALPPAYSSDYSASYWVVMFIGLGKLFDMATGVNGTILNTSIFYRWDTLFFTLLIGVTIGLNLWLIPQYGIVGSALASALSVLAFNSFRTGFVFYKFKLWPFTYRNVVVLLVGLAVFFVQMLLPIIPKISFLPSFVTDTIFRSVLVSVLFGGLVLLFRVSPDINILVEAIIKKAKEVVL